MLSPYPLELDDRGEERLPCELQSPLPAWLLLLSLVVLIDLDTGHPARGDVGSPIAPHLDAKVCALGKVPQRLLAVP